MRRRLAVMGIWIVGTIASVALAWTAVSAVGGEVTSRPPGGLTAGQVADAALEPPTTAAGASEVPTTVSTGATPAPTGDPGLPTSPTASTPTGRGNGSAPPPSTAVRAPSPSGTTSAATAPPPTAAAPAPTQAPAPAAPPAEPSSRQTFEAAGGSLGVTCTGSRVALQFATPRAGYAAEVHGGGGDKVDVRFENDDRESRIVVTCAAGAAAAEVRED